MKVNFVIAGTQKGGTTALCHFINQHPQVECLPEPHYFNHFAATQSHAEYEARFEKPGTAERPQELALGDCTPIYMYLDYVPGLIHDYNPQMKVVTILRNPVDRAYSHYSMMRQFREEKLPFRLALALENRRLARARARGDQHALSCHSYKDRGRYTFQIERLRNLFGHENVLVLLNEDLRNEHEAALRRVFDFLGVEHAEVPLPEKKTVHHRKYRPMSKGARAHLKACFHDEILRLQQIIDRDLSCWLHDR